MPQADKPKRQNRPLTVDFHDQTLSFELLSEGGSTRQIIMPDCGEDQLPNLMRTPLVKRQTPPMSGFFLFFRFPSSGVVSSRSCALT
jgi:hypothetical protein